MITVTCLSCKTDIPIVPDVHTYAMFDPDGHYHGELCEPCSERFVGRSWGEIRAELGLGDVS